MLAPTVAESIMYIRVGLGILRRLKSLYQGAPAPTPHPPPDAVAADERLATPPMDGGTRPATPTSSNSVGEKGRRWPPLPPSLPPPQAPPTAAVHETGRATWLAVAAAAATGPLQGRRRRAVTLPPPHAVCGKGRHARRPPAR